jgi:predicted nucleic acid-binding protein
MNKPKLYLFIDTNIFLSFYAYTSDDVEELRKLSSLIKTGQLKLFLTEQVKDEFYRNREDKLKESIREFGKASVSDSIPRFMEKYSSINNYRKARNALLKAKDDAITQAQKEAAEGAMAADTLFRELVDAAGVVKVTAKVYEAATRRMALGNPPGKQGSLGDRINWEILLAHAPQGADLHIVSRDGDFASPLLPAPNSFLLDEWSNKTNGILHLHDQLKPLLKKHFPHIKLAIDAERRAAVEKLTMSGNFATTHAAVDGLTPLVGVLTSEDIHELVEAATSNSQITWILGDEDVHNLYSKLLHIEQSGGEIDPDDKKCLEQLLKEHPTSPD